MISYATVTAAIGYYFFIFIFFTSINTRADEWTTSRPYARTVVYNKTTRYNRLPRPNPPYFSCAALPRGSVYGDL